MEPSAEPTPPVYESPVAASPATVTRPKARELLKQSYAILKSDKELVLFPIYSAVFSVISFALIGGLYMLVRWGLMHGSQNQAIDYLFLFILYVVSYYIVIYFNAGLAACVLYRFRG